MNPSLSTPAASPDVLPSTPLLVAAARRLACERAPVWIMRQAGRYLPEYRAVREKVSFIGLCKTPELAAEVSIQPVDRLGVDAAILFSDILIPLEAMGLELEFTDRGPHLPAPVRDRAAIERLVVPDPREKMPFVAQAVRIVVERLAGRVPVIGFAGAPFTLACYAVDGGGSKDFARTRAMMHAAPADFALLLERLADTVAASLEAQVDAGVQLVQLFDSWGGNLSEAQWRTFALPATARIVSRLQAKGVPVTLYLGGGPHLIDAMADTGADVLGLDWRVDLKTVLDRLGDRVAVQGNLDPTLLYAPPARIREEVARIARGVAHRPHIWNLGHGILPDVPVEHAQAFVRACQELRS